MAVKGITCLIALSIIAAGCLGGGPKEPSVDGNGSPTRTSGPGDATNRSDQSFRGGSKEFIDFVDCDYFPVSFQLPQAMIEHALPAEYEPVGFAPDLAQMNLFLIACDDFTISNHTVGRDVTMATLVVQVEPPEAVKAGADIHLYRLESFVSNESLASIFQSHGATITPGSVSWQREEASFTARVQAGESLVYEIQGSYGTQTAPILDMIRREHYQGPGASMTYIDHDATSQAAAWPGPFILTAESGLLAEASPYIGGLVSEGTYSATLTFHEKTAQEGT